MLSIKQLISRSLSPLTQTSPRWLGAMLAAATLYGCGGSSSDTDSTGYLKFYNASSNAPYIYLELNESSYSGADFSKSNGMYEIDSNSYDMTLSWKEGTSDYNTIDEQSLSVKDDMVSLVVLAGDISAPDIQIHQYEDEDPETEDDVFTFRWLNLHPDQADVDVYYAKDFQTFNEATLLGSQTYGQLSESHYIELDSYKFYLTAPGSTEVLFESEDIPFIYTSQYVMAIRANTGPGDSPYTLDRLTKTGTGVAYSDIDSGAELKIYNGLTQHQLLPQFSNQIDVHLEGVNGNSNVDGLSRGQFSEALSFNVGDYALDITPSDNDTAIAKNRFLSLPSNSDRTVFIYLSEAVEEDGDEEETVLYINTLPVDNSTRVSLYDHHIKVINLVDDFENLNVYFVRSNETVDTAEYKLFSKSGIPATITLENNSYDVSVIGSENNSELLLNFDHISLDADSGDIFMIIEEDTQSESGYSVKFVAQ